MEAAVVAREKLEKIKQDPHRALFSEFTGTSPSGAVSVQVDLLGRFKHVRIRPGTLREGDESWLEGEIGAAHAEARRAADFLDFNLAELASELEDTPNLRRHVQEHEQQREQPPAPRRDDDYFDDPLRRHGP